MIYWLETQRLRVLHQGHRLRYWFFWDVLNIPKASCYCNLHLILRSIRAVPVRPEMGCEHQ